MNKKAFTLVEVMISITIFSIVIVFLYESLNLSKKFNDIFARHVDNYIESFDLQKILYLDIIEAKGNITITPDRNKNTILKIINTNNTYHSVFSKYITYFINKNGKLIRVESSEVFNHKKINSDFLDHKNTYIDILKEDVEKFLVLKNKQSDEDKPGFTIFLKLENEEEIIFSSKKLNTK